MLGIVELFGGSILDDLPPTLVDAVIRHMPGGYSQENEENLESYIESKSQQQSIIFDKVLLIYAMRIEFRDVRRDLRQGKITKQEAAKRLEVIVEWMGYSEEEKRVKQKLKVMIWRL